jgi:hypothetical protein
MNAIEIAVTSADTNNTTSVNQISTNSGCPPTNNMSDPSLAEEDMPQELLEPTPHSHNRNQEGTS